MVNKCNLSNSQLLFDSLLFLMYLSNTIFSINIISTNKDLNVNSISDLSDKKIGVLKDDISYINYYFTKYINFI